MLNKPTELSQIDAQLSNPTEVIPKSKSQHGIQEIHRPILLDVPAETLTAITSYLDPPSLLALANVATYLNRHVKDDNTWRRAFVQQFLGIGPESDLDDQKCLLLRRSEKSWRLEFISRYKLIRRWERSRNVTTAHIPVHSIISGMHMMPSHSLLTSSIEYGIVGRSIPLTGKILPGYLDASGTRAGLGIGNPNAEFAPNVSACAMTSDGGTAKIVWGSRAGDIHFMNAPKTMESSRRSAAQSRRCNIADQHIGSVLDVKWLDAAGGWALSGGADGCVKLWDVKDVICTWSSINAMISFAPDPCVKVAASIQRGYIVGVFRSGEIHIWTGIGLVISPGSITETVIKSPIRTSIEGYDAQAEHEVTSLHIDPTNVSPTILVAYQNDPFFYRITLSGTNPEIIAFGDPFFGPASIVSPFFRSENEQQSQPSSFVLVGDHIGCVSLYAWDVDALDVNSQTGAVNPVRKFEAHNDGSSVTAIAWNGLTLITGSARGTTHVWDALTFVHLRSFASPVPRLRGRFLHPGVDPVARQSVRHILVTPEKDVLFVGVGDHVLAWQAGPVARHTPGGVRGRHTSGTLSKKKSRNAKYLEQLELKENIMESRDLLQDQSSRFRQLYGQERAHRESLDNLGLSEVEAVEYVLMLSRDEANAQANAEGSGSMEVEEGVFESDFEFEDADSRSIVSQGSSRRPSSSSSAFGSPPLSSSSSGSSTASSRSGMTTGAGGRLIPRVVPSPSNQKIQISPSFRMEAMEAGVEHQSGGTEPESSTAGTRMHLEDHFFPAIGTGTSPTGRAVVGATVPTNIRQTSASPPTPGGGSHQSLKSSAWNTPLKKQALSNVSGPASPSTSRNVWAGHSRISPPARVQQQHQTPRRTSGMASMDDVDDDLRFAIELSLVEARSRGENV